MEIQLTHTNIGRMVIELGRSAQRELKQSFYKENPDFTWLNEWDTTLGAYNSLGLLPRNSHRLQNYYRFNPMPEMNAPDFGEWVEKSISWLTTEIKKYRGE